MCLGFDVPNAIAQLIEYVPERLPFNLDEMTGNRMMFTKFADWRYEAEVRAWSTTEEKEGQFYYQPFGESLRLTEVICGANNPPSCRRVMKLLLGGMDNVRVIRAAAGYDAFRMIEDEAGID